MRLKVFCTDGLADALSRVRRELGAEALILSTRRIATGVEVTAALEEPEEDLAHLDALPPETPKSSLAHHGIPPALASGLPTDGPDALARALTETVAFAPLPDAAVMLVGLPGAGKTLTTARLATRAVLAGGSPTVISTDGKRAGAAEQLAAYTRLLKLSLIVAPDPVARRRSRWCFQRGWTRMKRPLSLGPVPRAGAHHLIATRPDLARRLGSVLAAAHPGRLSLAEAGVGPGAADGLVPLTPDFLAKRLLALGVPA